MLKSPPLVLDSLASDARSLELPPDLLGRRGRQVSSSFLVHGSVAIGAGRLHLKKDDDPHVSDGIKVISNENMDFNVMIQRNLMIPRYSMI